MKKHNIIIAAFIAVLMGLTVQLANFYTDFAWFENYGKTQTFWTLFLARYAVQGAFAFLYFLLFVVNLAVLKLLDPNGRAFQLRFLNRIPGMKITTFQFYSFFFTLIILFSVIMGGGGRAYWEEILSFIHQVPFSSFPADPIFNKDISFFNFTLPFYNFIYGWILSVLITISLFSVIFHVANETITLTGGLPQIEEPARKHLSILAALFLFLFAWGYNLAAYQILFSQRGKFYGAGFTAVNAELLSYKICMILSIIAGLIMLFNFFRKSFKLALGVIGITLASYFILGSLLPSFQQRFIVEPDELAKETPFIKNNIEFTRYAYRLDKIKSEVFTNEDTINAETLEKNKVITQNIRLWDWKPLRQTYRQLQELKPYYNFIDVDVDRYKIDGIIKAVDLSGRELLTSKLSSNSQTWINTHLVYTHGYGIVMSNVDKVTPEGLPEFIVKDIPPQSKVIDINRPEIYYGEHNNDFIITNTEISPGEFDYPFGETNKYTTYQGTGGVLLDTIWKRAAFALSFSDINILISSNITNKSRIHFRRNIREITNLITPYIEIDRDPYIVVAGGRLYFMIDGYTVSNYFPYSTPINLLRRKRINYISNSVKITIDAYNGEVRYFFADDTDPIIKTYANIFPDVYESMSEMPTELKKHIRYPESLFDVQTLILLRYHMNDVTVFYNNEDAWELPKQKYDASEETMDSYYIVTKLPGEEQSEFVLMMPFTPLQKDNMLSFLVARCDGEYYGELKLYRLPKERLSYGPMQIEARINQDAEISKQLTLWSQKGSSVIRGNMLAIPIEQSLLYVQPLYLQAESSQMPELKRVIVSYRDKITMGENLSQALETMFGSRHIDEVEEPDLDETREITEQVETESNIQPSFSSEEILRQAQELYSQAENELKDGNFEAYGRTIKELGDLLNSFINEP
jgi:uncharacterized membrane protein (UPF0182 family)